MTLPTSMDATRRRPNRPPQGAREVVVAAGQARLPVLRWPGDRLDDLADEVLHHPALLRAYVDRRLLPPQVVGHDRPDGRHARPGQPAQQRLLQAALLS